MDMSCAIRRRFLTASFLALFLFGCATTDPYESVAIGDKREHVVTLLGNPSVPEKDFTPTEREMVRSTLEAMNPRGAETFSVWKKNGDRFVVVGFDKNGLVTVKRSFFYTGP